MSQYDFVSPDVAGMLQLEYEIDLTKEGHARGYQSHGSHQYDR